MDYTDNSEDSRTIYCGNLPSSCTEELLYELFLQAGPLEKVRIPTDREGRPASYGFVTYIHQCSVPYAINIFDGITLYKHRLNLRPRNSNNSPSVSNVSISPGNNYSSDMNRTPSGRNECRNEYYRNESLQGRWNNHSHKRDRNMRPVDSYRHSYKRHKRFFGSKNTGRVD